MLCQFFIALFEVHMSVHHNIIPSYSQQDATFLDLLISKDAVHVSVSSSAHHQEHTIVQTTSDIANQYCC
jgi:predicted nucleic-acid-binding protein